MTTRAAEAAYLAEHLHKVEGRGWAVYNPNNTPLADLPIIYGFNNGGNPGWYSGVLLAQDGKALGGHVCSDEGYMPSDLGVLQESRPDRHEIFRAHYPQGYRMEFVPGSEVKSHVGLLAAFDENQKLAAK